MLYDSDGLYKLQPNVQPCGNIIDRWPIRWMMRQCCSDGAQRNNEGSINRRNGRFSPTLTFIRLGRCFRDGARRKHEGSFGGKAHTVTGRRPACPHCTNDIVMGWGRGGLQRNAPGGNAMIRGDCPRSPRTFITFLAALSPWSF